MSDDGWRAAQGDVQTRYVVNLRLDPAVAATLLPVDWSEPQLVNGFAVMSFCPYVLERLRLRLLPQRLGVRALCSAYRLAVVDRSGSAPRAAAWVPARESTSRTVVALARRSLRAPFDRVVATVTEAADGTTEMRVDRADGSAHFRASTAPAASASSPLFADTAAFTEFFTAATTSWAPGRRRGTWMQLDLAAGPTHYSPMSVADSSPPAYPTVPSWTLPSPVGGAYCWSCAAVTTAGHAEG